MRSFFTGRFGTAALVSLVFGAGFVVARIMPDQFSANAQTPAAIMPQVINVIDLKDSDLNPVPNLPGNFGKTFVTADGATISVQTGNVGKHLHPLTNEIQYVVEGSGKIWLGDKQIDFKPGDMIIIPKGTPHAGTITTSGKYKAIAIKTPPQPAGDTKPVP
jgi:mannose-6-phosphate isomerase-like protein (cupin superfamily)